MSSLFFNPGLAAAAMACVALPILIHLLFRRRRKPVAFGAMRFLIEAFRKQRRRLRLEQFILLALRCLLVLLVAGAIGRPLIARLTANAGSGARTVVLVLDDSLTASRTVSGALAWERTQARAREVMGKLDSTRGDRVGVMLLGGGPRALVMPPTADIASAMDAVRTHEAVDAAARLGPSIARVAEQLSGEAGTGDVELIAISEWLAGSIERGGEAMPALPRAWTFAATRPVTVATSNVAVTSFQAAGPLLIASGPDSTVSFPVKISLERFGPVVSEAGVTSLAASLTPMAMVEGVSLIDVARESVRWAEGQAKAEVSLTIPLTRAGGVQTAGVTDWFASVAISGEADSIPADDVSLLPLTSREKLEVLIVGRRGDPSNVAAFSPVDWYTLALTPEVAGRQRRRDGDSIRVASASADVLDRGPPTADAVLVAEPETLSTQGWRSLRTAADAGALIVVSPPVREADQRWVDAFAAAFELELTLAREPRQLDAPTATKAPDGIGDQDLLRNLRPELAELLPSVTVMRVVDVVSGRHRPLLELNDSQRTPVMLELLRETSKPTDGRLVLLTAAPELAWTSLVATPLMVPLMQEMVRSGTVNSRLTAVCFAGGDVALARPAAEVRTQRTRIGGLVTGMPTAKAFPPVSSGIFDCRDAAGQRVAWLGVQPATRGSDCSVSGEGVVEAMFTPLGMEVRWMEQLVAGGLGANGSSPAEANETAQPPVQNPSNPMSLWLLAAALLAALVEALLARWFSHAGRTTEAKAQTN